MIVDDTRVRLVENVQDQGSIESLVFGKEFDEDCERQAVKKIVEFLINEGAIETTVCESYGHKLVSHKLEIIMPEKKIA